MLGGGRCAAGCVHLRWAGSSASLLSKLAERWRVQLCPTCLPADDEGDEVDAATSMANQMDL